MDRIIIPCVVDGDRIDHPDTPVGAAGGHDDVVLELTFAPSWRGTTRQILWGDALRERFVLTTLTLDYWVKGTEDTYRVPVPPEAKAVEGLCSVTIRGATLEEGIETSARVTTETQFRVLPSLWSDFAAERLDVSPSQAVQLQEEIDALRSEFSSAVTVAAALEDGLPEANAVAALFSFSINAEGHLILTRA